MLELTIFQQARYKIMLESTETKNNVPADQKIYVNYNNKLLT